MNGLTICFGPLKTVLVQDSWFNSVDSATKLGIKMDAGRFENKIKLINCNSLCQMSMQESRYFLDYMSN